MTASHRRALGQTRERDTEGRLGNLPKVHEPPGVGGLKSNKQPSSAILEEARTEAVAEQSARG